MALQERFRQIFRKGIKPDPRFSILDAAGEVVINYAMNEGRKADNKLYKEMHNNGCGCHQCLKQAVKETNSWINFFVTNKEEKRDLLYHLVETPPTGYSILDGKDYSKQTKKAKVRK